MTNRAPLSLLDFCIVRDGETAGQSMARSVELAQRAEALKFSRIWYSEHHNMPAIASSSPAVLISHIAAKTSSIRLGAGGVMLPNHAPYVIAEQFGTLAELYPDRIDLGLGRAPGTDQNTLGRALRRSPNAAEHFPQDVVELHRYLIGDSVVPGVTAVPGAGTNVPLYILGSSMFGATLAAQLGLPYSFASHFAPTHLEAATSYYRQNFQPSEVLSQPYCIAAINVIIDDTTEAAQEQRRLVERERVEKFVTRGGAKLTSDQLDRIIASPQGQQIVGMLRYTACGTADEVAAYLEDFVKLSGADELMISLQGPNHEATMNTLDALANVWQPAIVGAPGHWGVN